MVTVWLMQCLLLPRWRFFVRGGVQLLPLLTPCQRSIESLDHWEWTCHFRSFINNLLSKCITFIYNITGDSSAFSLFASVKVNTEIQFFILCYISNKLSSFLLLLSVMFHPLPRLLLSGTLLCLLQCWCFSISLCLSVSPSSLLPGLMYTVDVLTQSGVRADEFPSTSHSAGPLHFWTRRSRGTGVRTGTNTQTSLSTYDKHTKK